MNLNDMVTAVFEGWRRVALTALVVALLVSTVALVSPRTYTSSGSFVPLAGRGGALSGLAGQFGINLPGDAGGLSPEFYADFITSRHVLRWVISPDTVWGTTPLAVRPQVAAAFEIDDEDPYRLQAKVVSALKSSLAARSDQFSRVVQFSVQTADPTISYSLAEKTLRAVELFNAESRRSEAAAEASFSEARLQEARAQMDQAERRLSDFLSRNHVIPPTGPLALEKGELEREVGFTRAAFGTLIQVTEQARIEALRSKALVSRVETPTAPGIPDRRFLLLRGVVSLIAGTALGILIVGSGVMLKAFGEAYPEVRAAAMHAGWEMRSLLRWRRV